MEFTKLIILSIIGKSNDYIGLGDLWDMLSEFCDIVPDIALSPRNYYHIIESLVAKNYLTKQYIRGLPPTVSVKITPAGSSCLQSYHNAFLMIFPPDFEKGADEVNENYNKKRRTGLDDNDGSELQQSITAEISAALFNNAKVDGKLREKIEKTSGWIVDEVRKYI